MILRAVICRWDILGIRPALVGRLVIVAVVASFRGAARNSFETFCAATNVVIIFD